MATLEQDQNNDIVNLPHVSPAIRKWLGGATAAIALGLALIVGRDLQSTREYQPVVSCSTTQEKYDKTDDTGRLVIPSYGHSRTVIIGRGFVLLTPQQLNNLTFSSPEPTTTIIEVINDTDNKTNVTIIAQPEDIIVSGCTSVPRLTTYANNEAYLSSVAKRVDSAYQSASENESVTQVVIMKVNNDGSLTPLSISGGGVQPTQTPLSS